MSIWHTDRVISSGATSTSGSLGYSLHNETRSTPFDPLTILVPITDSCLIVYAIVTILAIVMVAFVVILAFFKKYFPESELWKYYDI